MTCACFLVVAVAVRTSARKENNEELRLAGTLFTRRMRGERAREDGQAPDARRG